MKVETFTPTTGKSFALVVIDNKGCGLINCRCCPKNFISISNGSFGLSIELNQGQVEVLKNTGRLEIRL